MTASRRPVAPVVPSHGSASPVGLDEVEIRDGFWGTWQSVNAGAILEHAVGWIERLGWLGNFDLTAAGDPAPRAGREFVDSETYKILEAIAWEYGRSHDESVDRLFKRIAARVVPAQDDDGYLNTQFGHAGQAERWSDLRWGHELYCAGHLIQAAVARLRTVGEDELVRAAMAVADNVVATFGDDGIRSVCGHPEIEVALAELGRATGRDDYVRQARLFVERRGHGVLGELEWGREYYQDDVPVREADVLRGHAVRAGYLSAGAVDVAVESGDDELLAALVHQWERTVATRTYLTGGWGSRHTGEAFGADFELPPDRAYSETCAGISAVMFSWRLYLATGELRYADHIERILYNVVATSPASDGHSFFYANPLHQREPGVAHSRDEVSPRADSSQRSSWFAVSCCPTNVARTFASLGSYVSAWRGESLDLLQYASGRIATTSPAGTRLELEVRTGYPVEGRVEVAVVDAGAGAGLRLRVPTWSAATRATVDGVPVPVTDGAVVVGDVRSGARVVLELDVAPRWTFPDRRVDAVRGCVAVEAGPLVMALESVTLPGGLDLHDVEVDVAAEPEAVDGGVRVRLVAEPDERAAWPYGPRSAGGGKELSATLHPYYRWGESGPTQMRVWIPVRGSGNRSVQFDNEGKEAF